MRRRARAKGIPAQGAYPIAAVERAEEGWVRRLRRLDTGVDVDVEEDLRGFGAAVGHGGMEGGVEIVMRTTRDWRRTAGAHGHNVG